MGFDNKVNLIKIISKCFDLQEIAQRTELLQKLNKLLPLADRFELPSFITNKYIDQKLYLLEEKYSLHIDEDKKTI
jgi:hypothetical protein